MEPPPRKLLPARPAPLHHRHIQRTPQGTRRSLVPHGRAPAALTCLRGFWGLRGSVFLDLTHSRHSTHTGNMSQALAVDSDGTTADWWSSSYRPFSLDDEGKEVQDEGKVSEKYAKKEGIACEQLMRLAQDEEFDLAKKYDAQTAPLEHHTFRRVLAYVKVHHNELEQELCITEKKAITKEEWMSAWRAVARKHENMCVDEQNRKQGCCYDDSLVNITQASCREEANAAGRDIVSRMMEDVFNLINVDGDGSVSEHEWRSFLLYEETKMTKKKSRSGSELRRSITLKQDTVHKRMMFLNEMKLSMRDELGVHQARACSVDLRTSQLERLLTEFLGKRDEYTCIMKSLDMDVISAADAKQMYEATETGSPSDRVKNTLDICRAGQKIRMNLSARSKGKLSEKDLILHKQDLDHRVRFELKSEVQMLRTYIQTDNLGQIEFGLGTHMKNEMKKLWHQKVGSAGLHKFDEVWSDTENIASCIVSNKAMEAFEKRLRVLHDDRITADITDKLLNLVKERHITEEQFCNAYFKATGIAIRDEIRGKPFFPLWKSLDEKFNGLIDKKLFFKSCMKGQSDPVEGLSYPINYAEHRMESGRRQRQFFWYILWVIVYTFYIHNDLDINKGFYLGLGIEEAISKEPVGDKSSDFFAWYFYDIANEGDFWQWLQGPLLRYVYPVDGSAGYVRINGHVNRIVGGIKIRQFRVSSKGCKKLDSLLNNEAGATCEAYGDTRNITDWMAVLPDEANMPSTPVDYTCKGGNGTTTRGIRVASQTRQPAEVVTEVLKILLNEQLGVAVVGDTSLPEASVGVWQSEAGNQSVGVSLMPSVTEGLYMTQAGVAACPLCSRLGYQALKDDAVRLAFGSSIYGLQGDQVFSDMLTNAGLTNTATGYNEVLHTSDDYDSVIKNLFNSGAAVLFYSYSGSPLVQGMNPIRIDMGAYDYQSPQLYAKVMSDLSDPDYNMDVQELLFRMEFTSDDLTSFNSAMYEGGDAAAVACDWVNANTYRWSYWIRTPVSEDTNARKKEYFHKCFDTWAETNDKDSFSHHSYYLNPVSGLPSGAGPDDDTPKVIYKVDDSGSVTDEPAFTVPTRSEYARWVEQAEGGNLTAEALWKQAQGWVFRYCEELSARKLLIRYRGNMADTLGKLYYSCDGYGMFFPLSMTFEEANNQLNVFQANQWIDVATRAVMVEFFVHSQSSRHISNVQFMVEISSTGAFVVSKRFNAFRLFQWETQKSSLVFILGIAFIWVILIHLMNSSLTRFLRAWRSRLKRLSWEASWFHGHFIPCCTCCTDGKWINFRGINLIIPFIETYFQDLWFFIDTALYMMIIVTWVFRFWFIWLGVSDSNLLCIDVYPQDYERAADLSLLVQQIDGINILIIFLRVLFYLESNHDMNIIIRTVRRASSLIFNLLVIFFVVIIGFVMSAWVVFGMVLERYRSSSESFQALLFMVMGQYEFDSMRSVRPAFALIFFLLFYVVIVAVIFNLLIGLMTAKFEEVNGESLDRETFTARVAHDPETASWMPPMGFRASVSSISWAGEIKFYWNWVVHKVTRSRDRSYVNRNPRIFWPKFKQMLEDLDSMSLSGVFRSYLHVKWMALSLGVRPLLRADTADAELGPLSVRDFIDKEVEESRRLLLELLIVQIPSKVLDTSLSRTWYELLLHHREWRNQVSKWAKFDHGNALHAAAYSLQASKRAVKVLRRHLRKTTKE